jgi:hypothetical protein
MSILKWQLRTIFHWHTIICPWKIILFAAVMLALPSCNLGVDIPAPRINTADPYLTQNGEMMWSSSITVGWIPGRPPIPGTDFFILEFLDDAGGQVFSTIIRERTNPRNEIYAYLVTGENVVRFDEFNYVPVACGRTYGWHVLQMAGLVRSPWSEEWSFRVPPAPRTAPALIWPLDGATIDSGALRWNIVGDGFGDLYGYGYRIMESPDEGGDAYLGESRTGSLPIEEMTAYHLVHGQTYYWQVLAQASSICPGPFSAVRSFIWMGPDLVSHDLPAPSSPCIDDGDCSTPTRETLLPTLSLTPSPSAPPSPSPTLTLHPTNTFTLPKPPTWTFTPWPTKTPTVAPPPKFACSDYSKIPEKCKEAGCYYWSDNTCSNDPETPPKG